MCSARKAAAYLVKQQLPEGGWASYPGGPLELSGSVKAYFALKLTGHSPDADYMVRARQAILAAGGAEKINSFTRYYLALLGVLSYRQCPAVPPEIMLVPKWAPFNVYEMSSWSRTIVVPLSILWAFKPVRNLPAELGIRELFLGRPDDLPVTMPKSDQLDGMTPARRGSIGMPSFATCGESPVVEIRRSFSTLSLSSTGHSPGRALDVRTVRQERRIGGHLSAHRLERRRPQVPRSR